jgi:hypothetical protein
MRRLRRFLAGAVTLMLLGGSSGTTMAQDQQATATHVTGASAGGRALSDDTAGSRGDMGARRDAVYEHEVEWSDPRLPSSMRVAENFDWHPISDKLGAAISIVSSVRLEGPDGAWAGLEYGLLEQLDSGDEVTRLMVLSGEGGYGGLSAMLARTYETADYGKPIFDGYIFDAEMVPMPEAVEPFGQPGGEATRDDDAAEDVPTRAASDVEADAPVWVTGTVMLALCSGMTSTSEAGVVHERGYVCGPQRWSTSDPRLTGTATLTWNADVYDLGEATISLSAGTYDVRSESGGWLCDYADGVAHGSGSSSRLDNEPTLTCIGDGANEGLSAMLTLDWSDGPPNLPLRGFIFAGEAPPLPGLATK